MCFDSVHHMVGAEREPAVVSNRRQPIPRDARLQGEEGAELGVPVLLHDEHPLVLNSRTAFPKGNALTLM
jgi:hypothetical protein